MSLAPKIEVMKVTNGFIIRKFNETYTTCALAEDIAVIEVVDGHDEFLALSIGSQVLRLMMPKGEAQ